MKPTFIARSIFGAAMLANGANYYLFSVWPIPSGHELLAIQLINALVHTGLYGVAMAIELVTGALILSGLLVAVALCVVMPISTCALFWAVVLDHRLLGALVATTGFALNALLMLAYLPHYGGVLRLRALSLGESKGGRLSFDLLFVNPNGRTSRGDFTAALLTLLAVVGFYLHFVGGRTGQWCLLMLLYPAVVLHIRRLHDMGQSGWLALLPGVLMVVLFIVWLHIVDVGTPWDTLVFPVAVTVVALYALWGCLSRGQSEPNRFGVPVSGSL